MEASAGFPITYGSLGAPRMRRSSSPFPLRPGTEQGDSAKYRPSEHTKECEARRPPAPGRTLPDTSTDYAGWVTQEPRHAIASHSPESGQRETVSTLRHLHSAPPLCEQHGGRGNVTTSPVTFRPPFPSSHCLMGMVVLIKDGSSFLIIARTQLTPPTPPLTCVPYCNLSCVNCHSYDASMA